MSFPWRDSVTGNVFELPYIPSTREEMEEMLAEMRARREVEVASFDPVTAKRHELEARGKEGLGQISRDLGLPEIASGIGEEADWLANSSPLRPMAEAFRQPGGREMFRSVVPGAEAIEAIPSLFSGAGALAGASIDQPPWDVPDLRGIVGRGAEEGLPSALEMVAPIDLLSLGFSGAAGAAARIPRIVRATAPLARAATAADIFEGVIGSGQVVHGAATGDPLEAGIGAVRAASGTAAALPRGMRDLDLGAAARQGLEDVAPYVESMARDLGYTDAPVTVSRMAPERPKSPSEMTPDELDAEAFQMESGPRPKFELAASFRRMAEQKRGVAPTAPVEKAPIEEVPIVEETIDIIPESPKGERPSVPEGYVRVFRSGDGNFFTTNEPRAGSYEGEGSYVDIPQEVFAAGQIEAQKYGQPTPQDTYLSNEWVKKAQRSDLVRDTFDATEEIDAEKLFEELGVERVGESPLGEVGPLGEEIPIAPPKGLEPTAKQQLDYEQREALEATRMRQEADSAARVRAGTHDRYGRPIPPVVEESPLGAIQPPEVTPEPGGGSPLGPKNLSDLDEFEAISTKEFGEDWRNTAPDEVKAMHEKMVEIVNKSADNPPIDIEAEPIVKPETEQIPEIAEPIAKPALEAKSQNKTEFHFSKQLTEVNRKQFTDAGFEEVINEDGSVDYRKGPAAKGQSFTDFMQERFGDKTTTSRERAIARAEWNRKKEDRKLLKLAEDAGIPPEKMKEMLESAPKEGPETGSLSAWRRAVMPVIDNFGAVHPWLKSQFMKYVDEAETPAMKNIADSWRIKRSLAKDERRLVIDILDGKKFIDDKTPNNVRQAAVNYRAMLDQTWTDAIAAGVRKATDRKRQTYFPHKFAEGWDDNLVQNLYLDRNWDLKESNLEKARLSKRADYRRDLDVLDEYFLSAYRRISEVNNFGKKLDVLKRFAKKNVTDKATSEWLQRNIIRVMGREHPTSFDRFAGHARHVQALSDLGLAAAYQPIQATNTVLYGGLGRSMRALQVLTKNAPDEIYDAIRSGALTPNITQEFVASAYGAREGIPSRAFQKFMYGIPTIDRWTRIHANTVGKYIVSDAMKGNKGAISDIRTLGFDDIRKLDDLKKAMDADPDFGLKVGKALSDKALFRSGALEVPGWSSSTSGKLATQYMRFMYRHALFVSDIFAQAGKGNVRPLARFLTVAPVLITGMAEILYPIREGIRETLRQGVEEGEFDAERIVGEALGDEDTWNEEVEWRHILRNKRIPWTHPLKRSLQNGAMWGGIGVFQLAIERILGATGSPIEVGAKALLGPVPGNVVEGVGSVIKDVNRLPEDIGWDQPPLRNTRRWGVQQVPVVGYPAARRMKQELWE